MNAKLRVQSRERGNGIRATMAASGRKARQAMDEAGEAMHRGSVAIGRAERRLVSGASRVGHSAARSVRRHPAATVSAVLAGAGLLYLLARMSRRN